MGIGQSSIIYKAYPYEILKPTGNQQYRIFLNKDDGNKLYGKDKYGNLVDLSDIGGTASQLKKDFEAGENLSSQRVVKIINNKAYYLDQTDENNVGFLVGVTNNASLSGDQVTIVLSGVLNSVGWGLTPNSVYYISGNGQISDSPQTVGISQRVGVSTDSDTLIINFSEPVILI